MCIKISCLYLLSVITTIITRVTAPYHVVHFTYKSVGLIVIWLLRYHYRHLRLNDRFPGELSQFHLIFTANAVNCRRFWFWRCDFLFVYEVSREPQNGYAPNSHARRVWCLARTSLKVKVNFVGLSAVYVWKNIFALVIPLLDPEDNLWG